MALLSKGIKVNLMISLKCNIRSEMNFDNQERSLFYSSLIPNLKNFATYPWVWGVGYGEKAFYKIQKTKKL